MKRFLVVLLAGVAMAALSSVPASATCTDNGTTEFCLDVPLVSPTGFAPGDIVVKVVFDPGANTLTVSFDSCVGCTTPLLAAIGWSSTDINGNNLFNTLNQPGGWNVNTGGDSCCGGFDFTSSWTTRIHEGGGDPGPVTFALSGTPQGDPSTWLFTVHIISLNEAGCSMKYTNNDAFVPGPPSGDQVEQCGGTTEVPEPGSLALLGTGLFSAVGVLRRKLLKA